MTERTQKKVIHGGCGKQLHEKTGKKVLDFSASTNPLPPAISWRCDPFFVQHYPDDQYTRLKEKIASVFCKRTEEICVGNGSMELIRVFCNIAFKIHHTFYTDHPTFGEYEFSARLAGGTRVQNMNDADICFICNPNNPTGSLRTRTELLKILETIKDHDGILCLDEAFIELSDPAQSLVDHNNENTVILRSLTKSFSVPGIRFGYGFGNPGIIEKMEMVRPPWSVNAYAEAFALEAFRHYDKLEQSRTFISRERTWLSEHIQALGLSVKPSAANFLLVKTGQKAGDLCRKLAIHDILVRDCTSFGLPDSIRIAVRTRDEHRVLLEALSVCLR